MSKATKKAEKIPTVADIEQQVWEIEGVRIVIRLPEFVASHLWKGQGYTYKRALNRETATIGHLCDRLSKGVFGAPVSFVVVDGRGTSFNCNQGIGQTQRPLRLIRATYKKS